MSKSFVSVAALSLGLTIPAGATTVTIGQMGASNYVNTTFGPSLATATPGVWTSTGTAGTANATNPGVYIDPLTSGYFAYVEGGASITATFASGITGLDFVWGSPDGYNTLTLTSASGSETFVPGQGMLITATPVLEAPVLFQASPGIKWTSISFTSSSNTFEFGNVETLPAPAAATPEPASIALLLGGLLTFAGLRRRKSA